MSKIIVIIGPTASGKTKLSISLAKELNAEIINADAVQVYKNTNIGTAKITESEMEGITHHMIDSESLDRKYTVYDYQRDARKILDNLIKENKNVVIVGGSGLYVKALLYNYNLEIESKENHNDYESSTNEELKQIVNSIDSNNEIHVNNRKRMIRFINHFNSTNKVIKNESIKDTPLYDFKIIGLRADRKEMYNYINKRVDNMFDKGLLEEAKKLYESGINTDSIIGYKELNKYFKGECTLEEAIDEIKKNTRHYAKRQVTWNNHQFDNVNWIDVNYDNFNKTIESAKKLI